jgi:DNA helicase HerA-like ATPase
MSRSLESDAVADGFHLGKLLGKDESLVLDPDDLTTHAVIVGMTGSGKTGLGIVLLEEALARGIPALILDPKGDMGNLALTFPDLSAASFRPWIDESTARDAGLSVDEYAEQTATRWKEGLARAGIGLDRIEALRAACEVTIYTPGSEAGVPLNVIGSLEAPALSWDEDEETIRDEIEGTVSSLLGLVGIDADPLGSREHVLLANLLEHNWRAGRSLDLGTLISHVQTPPLRKLGVFDVDAFMPAKERTELAMRLNALVASPSFAAWGRGPALDPRVLLRTEEGTPRAAVVYLAHLSDEERQLVVTLVLSRLITWMHEQPGTSELRALVYLDEVYGFAPPTAAPPSKKPILTLMKRARAFGIGLVVATQNPVDLDYKAMANAGSWFIGRLQTENDKKRVLEGLRSAAGGVDVDKLDTAIGGLEQRQFLLQSAHRKEPELFSTRWAMSFLRGPLTKEQIEQLTPDEAKAEAPAQSVAPAEAAPTEALAEDESAVAPAVAPGTSVRYLDPAAPWAASIGAAPDGKRLQAFLAARVSLRYDDTKAGLDTTQEWEALYGPLDAGLDLDEETTVDYDDRDFHTEPVGGGSYVLSLAPLDKESFFRDAARSIQRRVADRQTLELFRCPGLDLYSRPGETQEQFAARADEAAQAAADAETAKIRDRLEAKRDRLDRALETARRKVEEADTEQSSRRSTEVLSGIGSVIGVLLGGKANTRTIARAGRALGSAASRRGMTSRAGERKRTAEERVETAEADLEELEQELLDEVAEIDERWQAKADEVETVAIRLESTDVRVVETTLLWVPTA